MKSLLTVMVLLVSTTVFAKGSSNDAAANILAIACTIDTFCPPSMRTEVDLMFSDMREDAERTLGKKCNLDLEAGFDPVIDVIEFYKSTLNPGETTCLDHVKY